MAQDPDPNTFRTGRFECRMTPDGRKVTVGDTSQALLFRDTITAKVTEWVELGEAIRAHADARALQVAATLVAPGIHYFTRHNGEGPGPCRLCGATFAEYASGDKLHCPGATVPPHG